MYLSCFCYNLQNQTAVKDIPTGSLLKTDVLPAVLLLLFEYKGNETTACALPTPAWLLFAIEEQGTLYICILLANLLHLNLT